MAKVYDVNRLATYGGSTAMFYLKETLVSASWVVSQSSDGTTFYSASDGITTDGPGAGGMNNASAWYFIKDQDGRRGFTVCRGLGVDGDRNWTIYQHEHLGLASFGTASVASPPIATRTDGGVGSAIIIGSGSTDCDLTFDQSGSFYAHTIAFDETHNGVWPFFHLCSASGTLTGKTMTLFHCDPFLSGTTEEGDISPTIWKFIYCTAGTNRLNSGTTVINVPIGISHQNTRTYIRGKSLTYINLGKSGWTVQLPAGATSTFSLGTVSYGQITTEIYTNGTGSVDGTDILIPITWINAYNGYRHFAEIRGISAYGKINLNGGYDGAGRYYPDTINLATDAYVMVGSGYAIPWPENITPVI